MKTDTRRCRAAAPRLLYLSSYFPNLRDPRNLWLLPNNSQCRNRGRQHLGPRIGGLRALEIQALKIAQSAKMNQAGVGDGSVGEPESQGHEDHRFWDQDVD